jgi:hypothetical protein
MIVPWNAKNHFVAAMCGITLGIVAHFIIIQPQNRRVRGTLRSNLNARVRMGLGLHWAVQQR